MSIYFTGDIHGEFNSFGYGITRRYGIKNAHVIVAGDIGMGFYKHNYYVDMFTSMNKRLSALNVHVYFVRGNHDNPDYFNNTPEDMRQFSHIHLVRDYTVLQIEGHNILCVGGAASVDKKFRTKDVDWWEFENVLPYHELNCKDIDIVVTHCAPIFCPPKFERISWMDDELHDKAKEDRIILAKLYFDLIKHSDVKYWFYGHYHDKYESHLSTGYFTEIDQHYLMSGEPIDENCDEPDGDECSFIGLDMMDNKATLDLYKIE